MLKQQASASGNPHQLHLQIMASMEAMTKRIETLDKTKTTLVDVKGLGKPTVRVQQQPRTVVEVEPELAELRDRSVRRRLPSADRTRSRERGRNQEDGCGRTVRRECVPVFFPEFVFSLRKTGFTPHFPLFPIGVLCSRRLKHEYLSRGLSGKAP